MPTLMPGAIQHPVRNFTPGNVGRPPMGMVLHITTGPVTSTDEQLLQAALNWSDNPTSRVSAYFIVAKDGRIFQCVDLDNKAWTQMAGNHDWIGVENVARVGEALTPAQVKACSAIFAWLRKTFPSIPRQLSDSPSTQGLGWHGMGGVSWGDHPSCPGEPVKAQRTAILQGAGTPPGLDPPLNIKVADVCAFEGGYVILQEDGAVFNIRSGYYGGANGKPYFVNRKAATIRPHDPGIVGYVITDTDGETYNFPE